MPQFDFFSFFVQLFWLILFFFAFYLLNVKQLPKLGTVQKIHRNTTLYSRWNKNIILASINSHITRLFSLLCSTDNINVVPVNWTHSIYFASFLFATSIGVVLYLQFIVLGAAGAVVGSASTGIVSGGSVALGGLTQKKVLLFGANQHLGFKTIIYPGSHGLVKYASIPLIPKATVCLQPTDYSLVNNLLATDPLIVNFFYDNVDIFLHY